MNIFRKIKDVLNWLYEKFFVHPIERNLLKCYRDGTLVLEDDDVPDDEYILLDPTTPHDVRFIVQAHSILVQVNSGAVHRSVLLGSHSFIRLYTMINKDMHAKEDRLRRQWYNTVGNGVLSKYIGKL